MLTTILATPHNVHFYAYARDVPFHAYFGAETMAAMRFFMLIGLPTGRYEFMVLV